MLLHPLTWPDGKRVAASITFDIDADSLIRNACPEDGHLRLPQVTQGRYGPTVAVPRILETWRRFGIRQTFFIPAWTMEAYPATVDAILKAGHEIGHHSWRHEDPMGLTDEQEGELFERALETHVRMTGRKPRGYRAPVYNATPGVIARLIGHEFLYDSSLQADEMPYLIKAPQGEIIELPPHWGADDWPPFAHFEEIGYLMPVRAPSDGIRNFVEEFEAAHTYGGFFMPVLHPFLTGRLARWTVMERWLETIFEAGDVWFAPLEEIAQFAKARRDELRVDTIEEPGA
ncbi:MAG: polysaccharide deacetylase [Pseudomonadota bacterium]